MNAISNKKTLMAEALLAAPAVAEADWARAFREAARARFLAMGAPIKRDEYWRYTDPAPLTRPLPPAPTAEVSEAEPGPFGETDAVSAVFVNGRFRRDLSGDLASAGVEVAPLSEAMAHDGWARDAVGALEAEGQTPVERPMAALNGALAQDGLVIRATGPAAKPIHVRALGGGEGAVHLRHVVEVAPGGALTLLESGMSGERMNAVIEARVADDAAFHHVRSQTEIAAERQVATALFAKLGARSELRSFTLRATALSGAGLTRNECVLWLTGEDAAAYVAGGVLGAGDALADNTVFLTHAAERCESRQVFKTVLDDTAQGVFQGKILVTQKAQKTDGYQISQSLLLQDRAQFSAKPELEIYADDVKCSHGSTTSAIDPTALFYLRSRGVPEAAARALLVAAFVDEAIDEIADEALQAAMRAEVAAWMTRRVA